jgi:hypothetical protein
MTSSNIATSIAANASYYTELTAATSYWAPAGITVTRNGTTLTNGVGYTYTKTGLYTATLSIPQPHNGNIVITAAAVQVTSTLILPYLDTSAANSYFKVNYGGVTYDAEDTNHVTVNMQYGSTAQLVWVSATHYATVTIYPGGDNPYTITMVPNQVVAYYSLTVYGTVSIAYTATPIASTKSMLLEDTSAGTNFAAAAQIKVGIFYGETEVRYTWNNEIADEGWNLTGIPYNSVIRFYYEYDYGHATVVIKNNLGQNAGNFTISPTHNNQAIQIATNFYVTVVTYD